MPPVQFRQDEQESDGYFALVSGFYGPGAFICWYLILASVFLENLLCLLRNRRPRVSSDFIAALLCPIIVNIHLIHQIKAFPREFRAYLLYNLTKSLFGYPSPGAAISQYHSTVTSRYEVVTSNPDYKDVYQKVAAMIPALRVMDIFGYFWLMCACVALVHSIRNRAQIMQIIMLNLVLVLTCISRVAFLLRFWNFDDNDGGDGAFSASGFLFMSAFFQGFYPLMGMLSPLWFIIGLSFLSRIMWASYLRMDIARNSHDFASMCWYVSGYIGPFLFGTACAGIFLGPFTILIWEYDYSLIGCMFIPPSGIQVTELDQTAAVLGGVFVLLLAIYEAWKQRRG